MCDKYRKCAKCGISAVQDPAITFHRFPKLTEKPETLLRCRIWAEFSFPAQDCTDADFLRKLHISHKVLCSRHFGEDSYMDSSKTKIHKFSIPRGSQHILQRLQNESAPSTQVSVEPQPGPSNVVMEKEPMKENIHVSVEPQPGPSNVVMEKEPIKENIHVSLEPQPSSILLQKETMDKNVHVCKKTSILKELGVKKTEELSTKEKKLYLICRKSLQKICILKNKLKNKRKCNKIEKLVNDEGVKKLFNSNVSDNFVLLLQSQIRNCNKKPKGRRYNIKQQILALTLYKKSPACYRLLRRMFALPCQSTLKKLLNKIPLRPGVNPQMFAALEIMAQKNLDEENICTLVFDEMSIKKNLSYNKKMDVIEGFQDHGLQGRTHDIASKALVFMLSGLRKKWKQPVAYYLSGNYTTADRLAVLIKEVLGQCLRVGLKVVATICDLSRVNIRALEILGATTEEACFSFEGQDIFTILDPPHLLKCFRNLFMKHDIICSTDIRSDGTSINGVAKWSHIKMFFYLDKNNPNFQYAPALTDLHINPNNRQKMRVKLAAQIFSHSVCAGILSKVSSNELPTEALATADFVNKIDQLFDSLNADTKDLRRGKKYSTNLTNRSPHLEFFKIIKTFMNKINFVGCKTSPPSQVGWIRTINAVQKLWEHLKNNYKIKSLSTRRLNQDVLENCFGCIRYSCGSSYNPTVSQFIAGIKTAIISNLKHSGHRRNCEDDEFVLANNLEKFLTHYNPENAPEDQPTYDIVNFENTVSDAIENIDQATSEAQACAYVCGFLVKKLNINCDNCKQLFLSSDHQSVHIFTEFREFDTENPKLSYVSTNFIQCIEICATVIKNELNLDCKKINILKHLRFTVKNLVDFSFLFPCQEHSSKNVENIVHSICFICLKRFLVLKNRELKKDSDK